MRPHRGHPRTESENDQDLARLHDQINEYFDILIEDTSLENEIKYLVIYKKGLYNADIVNEADILKILKSIINSESVWKSHALYLLGEYFYSKQENQKAKDFFEQVVSLENSNLEISLDDAIKLNENNKDKKVGDEVLQPLPSFDFGRIAAQTAKQVINSNVREAERERQFNDFIDKKDTI